VGEPVEDTETVQVTFCEYIELLGQDTVVVEAMGAVMYSGPSVVPAGAGNVTDRNITTSGVLSDDRSALN
jgi:hypothetical protein